MDTKQTNSERTDYGQYAVFMTNAPTGAVREYSYRWEIENGYKNIPDSYPDHRTINQNIPDGWVE